MSSSGMKSSSCVADMILGRSQGGLEIVKVRGEVRGRPMIMSTSDGCRGMQEVGGEDGCRIKGWVRNGLVPGE